MCCFTREVTVSGTRVFARFESGRQWLAYQMTFAADGDVAMVLPVPTPAGSAEDAVRFVDLSTYPEMFHHLAASFVGTGSIGAAPGAREGASLGIERLEVHDVGAFEASFVPSPREFLRLDPRFRLSPEVLAALPAYADWGFVVFKLRGEKNTTPPHPLAFSFPTRTPGELFFPCVHVHDGAVHATASFDHELYAQLDSGRAPRPAEERFWTRSTGVLAEFADGSRSAGLLDTAQLAFRVTLRGTFPNQDVWVRDAPESEADAETRSLSRAREERERKERVLRDARLRRSEIIGRVTRGLLSAPVAALLGFLVWISILLHRDGDANGFASAVTFSVAWLPAVGVLVQAVTGRTGAAWGAVAVCALLVAGGLLTG